LRRTIYIAVQHNLLTGEFGPPPAR